MSIELIVCCFHRQKAFDKAAAMKTLIGYPQELLVEENLENLFKGVRFAQRFEDHETYIITVLIIFVSCYFRSLS